MLRLLYWPVPTPPRWPTVWGDQSRDLTYNKYTLVCPINPIFTQFHNMWFFSYIRKMNLKHQPLLKTSTQYISQGHKANKFFFPSISVIGRSQNGSMSNKPPHPRSQECWLNIFIKPIWTLPCILRQLTIMRWNHDRLDWHATKAYQWCALA